MARTRPRFDISADTVFYAALVGLLAASVFFTISVEARRRHWRGGAEGIEVAAGAKVELVQVLDGDEVSVRLLAPAGQPDGETKAKPFVVRLVGVKAFAPTVNDPVLSRVGQTSVDSLKRLVQGVTLTVEPDQPGAETIDTLDPNGRLLAYLHADEIDLGKMLVEEGSVLVYAKYPFDRIAPYLERELEARRGRRGLWGMPEAAARADALKAKWAAEAAR